MRNCAIIVAAGKGTRMKSDISKQFIELKGNPILYYTIKAFENNENVDDIILVIAKEEIDFAMDNIVNKYDFRKIKCVVEGGNTRQRSVMNGLFAAKGSHIVMIHDGARPFVDDSIIEDGINYARAYNACACGVTPKDTIKIKNEEGFSSYTPQRETLFSVQTPQCFKYDLILEAHNKALDDGIQVTDDTMVVEHCNHKVYLYEGSYSNIKITTPEDLVIGETILESREVGGRN